MPENNDKPPDLALANPAAAAIESAQASPANILAEYEIPDSAYIPDLHDDIIPEQKAESVPSGTPEPEKPAAPQHAHPQHLTRMAIALGVMPEEIGATSTTDLREMVRDLAMFNRGQSERTAPVAPTTAVQQSDPLSGVDWGESTDGDGTVRKLKEADIAPGIVNALRKIAKENQDLKTAVTAVAQTQQQRAVAAQTAFMDKKFAENEAFFGKGSIHEINQNGPAMARRNAAALMAMNDQSQASFEQKVNKAVALLAGVSPVAKPKPQERVPTEVENAYITGGLVKPTNRVGAKEVHGREAAIRAATNKLREMSMNTGYGDEESSLPD